MGLIIKASEKGVNKMKTKTKQTIPELMRAYWNNEIEMDEAKSLISGDDAKDELFDLFNKQAIKDGYYMFPQYPLCDLFDQQAMKEVYYRASQWD